MNGVNERDIMRQAGHKSSVMLGKYIRIGQIWAANARVSRSAFVRLDGVVEFCMQKAVTFAALLSCGAEVSCSRSYWNPAHSLRD